MKKILWLPSWYPNRLEPQTGDFIQRHALAVSIYQPLQVIFVVKDEAATNTKSITVEHFQKGNLSEAIVYMRPFRTGIKQADRLISILKYIKISRQLVTEFIKREGLPSVVHVHVTIWAGITALWLKRKFKIPYLVTEHWTGFDKKAQDNLYKRDFFFRRSIKKVLKHTDLLLPVSDHLGKLIATDIANIPYKAIPNVVDTHFFTFTGSPVPVFRFIHVSTMNYQKNAEGILNSFSRLSEYKAGIELVMVGPVSDELKILSVRLGLLKNISWTGEISYHEVAAMLQQASCLVMFSRYENLPCVILEALCCGLPVIATRTGGIPEVINNSNGILIHTEEEEELLEAMIKMVENQDIYDKPAISKNAIASFNYEKVGTAINEIYKSYCNRD